MTQEIKRPATTPESIPEQVQMTKEDIIAQLNDAIEVQKLQTELQMLRTQLVLSRYDEVKYTIAFNEMTQKPEGAPEKPNESTTDNQEV